MKVGFVCGAWDLLHPGHLILLREAKDHCDHLVVGLHVDPSAERSEKSAPIETMEERRERLDSCRWVDEVHVYRTEAGLVEMLKLVKPDVRFLGTDYAGREYTGQELGIPIYWHVRNHSYSSSSLRCRIVEADG